MQPPSCPPGPSGPSIPVAQPPPPTPVVVAVPVVAPSAPAVPTAVPMLQPGWPPMQPAPVTAPMWPGATPPRPQGASGVSIAGMVLGIIAMVTAFVPCLNLLGAVVGVIGLILSLCGLGSPKKGPAIAGLILSMGAVLITVLMYVLIGSIDDDSVFLADPDDTSFRTY